MKLFFYEYLDESERKLNDNILANLKYFYNFGVFKILSHKSCAREQ